eukprot:TRINITY_DN38792_c0_g1_i1.p1 TRINITY_DN38792_c0_g1~~TRINITY_DN38792_c0_g1_i1.p1  ORF type:complete len:421 (-),score=111.80 TRINITY_DN38792_c0_g1_i1:112-1374(-)
MNWVWQSGLKTKSSTKRKEQQEYIKGAAAAQSGEEDFDDQKVTVENEDEKKKLGNAEIDESKEVVGLSDFELLSTIAKRPHMKVLLVKRKGTATLYTMKILKKDVLLEKQLLDRVLSARKLSALSTHPFVFDLKYAFQSASKLYMVSTFFPGGELTFHIRKRRRFSESQARFIVAEIVLAIGYIHSLGFIHRNVRPESILFDAVGHICVAGLGLCMELGPHEKANIVCGTAEYVAPEVVAGGGYDKGVDWWAVGVVLYELTIGIPPFFGQTDDEIYDKIQHGVLRFPPFLTEECKDLIIRLLNRNALERLGAGEDDVRDVKAHPFFASVDWDDVVNKRIDPPFSPVLYGAGGDDVDPATYIPFYSSEKASDSPIASSPLAAAHPEAFSKFDYTSPSRPVETFDSEKPLSTMHEDPVEIES